MTPKALFSELLHDSHSERWNEFELPKLSLGELQALCKLLGCPCYGIKETLVVRVTGHGLRLRQRTSAAWNGSTSTPCCWPYSYIMMQNSYYADAFERLATVCQERNVAMLTIKSIARSPWWGRERTRTTWYEPFSEQDEIRNLAYRRALGRSPRSTRSSRREARSQETVIGD
jgi:hypothetical protein